MSIRKILLSTKKKVPRIKVIKNLKENQDLFFLGQPLKLKITCSKRKPSVHAESGKLIVNFYEPHPQVPVQVPLLKWYRHQAEEYIKKRTREWAQKMQLSYNKIYIKDQSSRWGSCSTNRNLNFNWRAIMAPVPVIDYLIIHELSHLHEMNHSPAFWALVATYDTDYKTHRNFLNAHGKEYFNILPRLPVSLLNAVLFYV